MELPAHPIDGPTLLKRMYAAQETSSASASPLDVDRPEPVANQQVHGYESMLDTAADLVRIAKDPTTSPERAQFVQRSLDMVISTYQQASQVWLA